MITIEIKIPKEIRDYQESIVFGLSLRQCVFSLLAIGMAVLLYFGLRNIVGDGEIGWICIVAAFPFALGGFFRYNGMLMSKVSDTSSSIEQERYDLLQSHTARTMLANSEFLIMLNQAPTDRVELARLLNISDNQLSYITNVPAGRGLMKCGSAIVPFEDSFPKQTKLYGLMTTKVSEITS